ncbi:MAG: TolC family protein [Candidatus Omnitrophota bacterium]|nr:TolC family protein [Candidatus Omnitrophota bacterium]
MLINLSYEAGMEHKGAVLTAEANMTQAEFEITQAKRELEVYRRGLLKEMGRVEFSPIEVKGIFKISDSARKKPDFETLVKNNPLLGKLNAETNASSFGIKSKEADFFPAISANAGADRTGVRFPPGEDQWNIGVGLSIPIFEGGLRTAEVKKARAVYNQAQADERSQKDSLTLALEQAWTDFQNAIDTVDVQKQFLRASEERAKIAEGQYSLGLIQFDNWTIIEDSLVQAKKTFLNAEANALLTEAGWIEAKGETLEYED